jgi:hypothetical protein
VRLGISATRAEECNAFLERGESQIELIGNANVEPASGHTYLVLREART